MGINLGPLNIKDTYEQLVQISGSFLTDGSGSVIDNITVTASYATTSISASYATTSSYVENAVSASYALTATSASHAVNSDTAISSSHSVNADSAISSSYAVTASYAENVEPINTGSFYVSSSIIDAQITFNQGDGSTESVVVNNVSSSISASYATTSTSASHAVNSDTSISSSYATTATSASYALTASYAENATTPNLQQVTDVGSTTNNAIVITNNSGSTPLVTNDLNSGGTTILNVKKGNGEVFKVTSTDATNATLQLGTGVGYGKIDFQGSGANEIEATTSLLVDSPLTKFAGNVLVTGSLAVSGSIELTGSIKTGTGTNTVGTNGNEVAIGGTSNSATGNYSIAAGGNNHNVYGFRAGAFAGENSTVGGTNTTIVGGYANQAYSSYDAIVGGTGNISTGPRAVVLGGSNNTVSNYDTVIAGGNANSSLIGRSFIGGGNANVMSPANSENAAIIGGNSNQMTGNFHGQNAMVGGESNRIIGQDGTRRMYNNVILGGNTNYISADTSASGSYGGFILGGKWNFVRPDRGNGTYLTGSGIIGGQYNHVSHNMSVVIGGTNLSSSMDSEVTVPNLTLSGSGVVLTFADGTTQSTAAGGGGAAFPYTGSAQITGSFAVTGSISGILSNNENIELYQNVTVGNVTPNIIIGGRVGAFDTNGTNNILIGSSQNGQTDSNVNRYIGVTGTNYSNIIAGGLQNYISGSAGSRTANTIIGGNGNTIGKEDWAVSLSQNSIIGGYFHDIFAGSYNFIGGGSSQNIYTGSLDTTPSYNAFIGGGSHDIFGGDYNAFVGGYNSQITDAKQSVIVGGENHTITQTGAFNDFDSVIVGGRNSTITDHARSVILGGDGLTTTKNDEVVVPNLTISGSAVGEVNVLTDSAGTTTMDCSLGNFFTLTMPAGGSTTLTPSNIQAGQTINVKITQNATPSTIAFAASVEFEGGTAFAVSTGAGEVDVMTFVSFDGTSLQATGLKNFS